MIKNTSEMQKIAIQMQQVAEQIRLASMETVSHVKLNGYALDRLKPRKP